MATDGTNIIDGDRAHDTYWGIMDLYDSGAELEMIFDEFPLERADCLDDFDHEIYTTSCGLAYWELGFMTPERLEYIKRVIEKDACVKEWTKYSEKDGKSRKTVLKRYLKKIERTNEEVRKRKKYRKISHFIFNENSVLIFLLSTGEYAATVCVKIEQYRGECNYWLVPITYKSTSKPTVGEIKDSEILGSTIASGFSRVQTMAEQPGVENIWHYMSGKPNFFFGLAIHAIAHKDFLKIKDNFEKIGEIAIIDGLKKIGSIRGYETYEEYNEIYANLEEEIRIFGCQKYPIHILMNEDT